MGASRKIKNGYLKKRPGSNRWQLRYFNKITKNQCMVTTGETNEQKAREFAIEFVENHEQEYKRWKKYEPGTDTTIFENYSTKWFKSNINEWSDRHASGVRVLLSNELIPYFGELSLNEIGSQIIRDYRIECLEDLSATSVNHRLSIISGILKQANEDGIINNMPFFQRCKSEDVEAGRALSPEEIDALFHAAATINDDFVRFVALGYYAGLRHQVITGCQWRHVDFEKRRITFDKQKKQIKNESAFTSIVG